MKKVLVSLLIAGIIAGAWFWLKPKTETDAAEEKPTAKVEVTPLKRQSIARTVGAFGQISPAPSGEQVVAAQFDCIVRAVHASTGARVATGDLLLEIEPSPEAKMQFDSAKSTLALATKTLAATQERYDLRLANSQDLLTAQQAAEDAQNKMAGLEKRGVSGDGKITATDSGVVSKLELSSGSVVLTGTALITIVSEARLEARLGIEISEIAQISPGQPVTITSANRPGTEPVQSSVRMVGLAVDLASGANEIRVPIPNGSPLMLGEHVTASIVVEKKESLVVPRSAVLPDEEHQVIFTIKDGKAVRHEVHAGITADDLVEISGENLNAGDPVVTLGNYELTEPYDKTTEKEKSPAKESKS
jgi:membrane fusion protein (multidrug efflux system)